MSNCYTAGEGATHHAGCECHEARLAETIARLTAERDEALMHGRAVAAAADRMRAHEKRQDEMLRDAVRERDEARAELARQSAARVAVDATENADVARLRAEVERLREALLILADGPHHEECDVDRDVPRCVCVVGVAERLLATGEKGGA